MAVTTTLNPTSTGTLKARVCPVDALDRELIEAMWDLFKNYYEDIERSRFESDLSNKKDVILLFDPNLRQLKGFSTLKVFDDAVNGKDFVAVYSGDTIIDEAYWGQTALQKTFFRYIIKTKLQHPSKDVYWFLISKGYKTYLLLSRNFPNYWPRHDRPTPAQEKAILNHLATSMFADSWIPEKGVLSFKQPMGKLKGGIAPIDQSMLNQADIRFFLEKNQGHAQGDELCCIGRIDATLALSYPAKIMKKSFKKLNETILKPWPVQS